MGLAPTGTQPSRRPAFPRWYQPLGFSSDHLGTVGAWDPDFSNFGGEGIQLFHLHPQIHPFRPHVRSRETLRYDSEPPNSSPTPTNVGLHAFAVSCGLPNTPLCLHSASSFHTAATPPYLYAKAIRQLIHLVSPCRGSSKARASAATRPCIYAICDFA